MKRWIAPACLALAMAAIGVAGPSHAYGPGPAVIPPTGSDRPGLLLQVHDDDDEYKCLGFQRRDGSWTHDCGFGPEDRAARDGKFTQADIARRLHKNGYRVLDIDRDDDVYEVIAIDENGHKVRVYYDADDGDFIDEDRY